MRSVINFVCGPANWRAAFSKLYFWVDVHRGRVIRRKFEKWNNWAKPSPRFNPVIMRQTITGILRKIREIEASSIGVETLRGTIYIGPMVATQQPGITNNRQFRRIVVSVCPGSCTDIRRSLRFNLPIRVSGYQGIRVSGYQGIPHSGFFIFQNSLYEFTTIYR